MIDEVARHFTLGPLTAAPVRVAGGLSNELWRAPWPGCGPWPPTWTHSQDASGEVSGI
ncbi:hypothetical protein BJ973_002077 [Actinoplanes tereljensis]|uniref:hypothetical protein n=1 Tax=Paractinoplanes tereljensis TaxID=571912 RepID=UPI00194147D7|nr:hypothetical protein [Actinoplanes tereljensis]